MCPRCTGFSCLGHTLCLCLQFCMRIRMKSLCGSSTHALQCDWKEQLFLHAAVSMRNVMVSLRRIHSVKLTNFNGTGKQKFESHSIEMKHVGILRLLPTHKELTLLGILTTHLLLRNSHRRLRSALGCLSTVPKIDLTIVPLEAL